MNALRNHFQAVVIFIPLTLTGQAAVPDRHPVPLLTYITTWGRPGNDAGEFTNPGAVAADPSGFLYVSDTGNNRIQKLDAYGEMVKTVGGFGWGNDQLNMPAGLSAANGLDVFVADNNNGRIVRYDKDLHFISAFGSGDEWPGDLQFGFPLDVGITRQGELFCLDGENQRILKLNAGGEPQITFGDIEAGRGRLMSPSRMHISPGGRVYISDRELQSVLVYDIYGNFLFTFGHNRMNKPSGMTWIPPGILAVADPSGPSVLFFSADGEYLHQLNSSADSPYLFAEPVDVTLHRNRIYILDRKNACIHVFEYQIN